MDRLRRLPSEDPRRRQPGPRSAPRGDVRADARAGPTGAAGRFAGRFCARKGADFRCAPGRRESRGRRAAAGDAQLYCPAWRRRERGAASPLPGAAAAGAARSGRFAAAGPPGRARPNSPPGGAGRRWGRKTRDHAEQGHNPVHLPRGAAVQHRDPVPQLPVRGTRAELRVQGVHHRRYRGGHRRGARARHPRLLGVDAVQGGGDPAGRFADRVPPAQSSRSTPSSTTTAG